MALELSEEDVDEAFLSILQTRRANKADLEVLLTGAESRRAAVWTFAAACLGQLAAEIDGVETHILGLSRASRRNGRLAALDALRYFDSERIRHELIRRCLNDRSGQVRVAAADTLHKLGVSGLASDLNEVTENEINDKVRRSLCFYRDLVLHGFHADEPDEDGLVYVTIRLCRDGVRSVGRFATSDELADGGAVATAKNLAKKHGVVLGGLG